MILVSLRIGYHLKLLRVDRQRVGFYMRRAVTERGTIQTSAPSGGNNFHREILPRFQLVDQCENLPQAGSHLFPVSIFLTLQLNDTTLGQMIGKFDGLGALV